MTRYFAHISHKGSVRYGDVPGSIGVLEGSGQVHADRGSSVLDLASERAGRVDVRISKEVIPGRKRESGTGPILAIWAS